MNKGKTMATVSYGINTPSCLLAKLKREGDKLVETPYQPDDIFNFFITAAVLTEWVSKRFYSEVEVGRYLSIPKKGEEKVTEEAKSWYENYEAFPNPQGGIVHHIENCLSICHLAANASKHFRWEGPISDIGEEPVINDWYSYLFTSCQPDIYIRYQDENYGLQQIKGILIPFFERLISILDSKKQAKKQI